MHVQGHTYFKMHQSFFFGAFFILNETFWFNNKIPLNKQNYWSKDFVEVIVTICEIFIN